MNWASDAGCRLCIHEGVYCFVVIRRGRGDLNASHVSVIVAIVCMSKIGHPSGVVMPSNLHLHLHLFETPIGIVCFALL